MHFIGNEITNKVHATHNIVKKSSISETYRPRLTPAKHVNEDGDRRPKVGRKAVTLAGRLFRTPLGLPTGRGNVGRDVGRPNGESEVDQNQSSRLIRLPQQQVVGCVQTSVTDKNGTFAKQSTF